MARVSQGWVSAVMPGAVLEGLEIAGADDLSPLEVAVEVAAEGFLAKEGDTLSVNGFFDAPIAQRAVSIPSLDHYLRVGDRKTPLYVPESTEKMEVTLTFAGGAASLLAAPGTFDKTTPSAASARASPTTRRPAAPSSSARTPSPRSASPRATSPPSASSSRRSPSAPRTASSSPTPPAPPPPPDARRPCPFARVARVAPPGAVQARAPSARTERTPTRRTSPTPGVRPASPPRVNARSSEGSTSL